ncbi:MAG: hypothetical protein IMF12_11710, partial [Proteobacteria bacterium]|nr:hypothetical protein [Pseudomonadota bacterium]
MFTTIHKYLIIIILFIPILTMGQEFEVDKLKLALEADNLDTRQRVEIILQLASTYQNLGLSHQALEILLTAESNSALLNSKVYSLLSDVYLTTHQDVKARNYIDKSLHSLPKNAPDIINSTVLNNLGNVLTIEAHYLKAIRAYAKALKLATDSAELSGRIANNISYTYIQNDQPNEAINMLSIAEQHFNSLTDNYSKAFGLIGVGKLAIRLNADKIAYRILNNALKFTKQYNRLTSYAYGFLGHLYEKQQHYTEALQLTRQAIFFAKLDSRSFFSQQNQASEILYRWQWQLGRLFKVQHDMDAAIEA